MNSSHRRPRRELAWRRVPLDLTRDSCAWRSRRTITLRSRSGSRNASAQPSLAPALDPPGALHSSTRVCQLILLSMQMLPGSRKQGPRCRSQRAKSFRCHRLLKSRYEHAAVVQSPGGMQTNARAGCGPDGMTYPLHRTSRLQGSTFKPVPHVTKPQTPLKVPTPPVASAVPPFQSTGGSDSLRPFTSDSKRLKYVALEECTQQN